MLHPLCIVILRHVNNENSNKLWIESCIQVRKYYEECPLIVIDDNSDMDHVKVTPNQILDMKYYEITFIQSEYPKHGELLPYIYFLKYKWAEHMIFIHDSVFFQKRLPLPISKHQWCSIWNAIHCFTPQLNKDTMRLMKLLNHSDELIDVFNNLRSRWSVCFGVMGYISYNNLKKIEDEYKITKLLGHVHSRHDRTCLERLFACLYFHTHKKHMPYLIHPSISVYQKWGTTYEQYLHQKSKINKDKTPWFKVWTGR